MSQNKSKTNFKSIHISEYSSELNQLVRQFEQLRILDVVQTYVEWVWRMYTHQLILLLVG